MEWEPRVDHEYYTAWSVAYTGHDGVRKNACACSSSWADYDSWREDISYSSIAFHRFTDGTLKFPSKSCYYKKDYSDTSVIPTAATCNVKESATKPVLSTADCFPKNKNDVSIAFNTLDLTAGEAMSY